MAGNPYLAWVETFVRAVRTGEAIGPAAVLGQSAVATEAPKVLIFAPHPDDEIITGALPLRLMREQGFAVIDVAVTLGSRVDRRAQRSMELQAACAYIGFGLIHLGRAGLEGINLQARERNPADWDAAVTAVAGVLAAQQPVVAAFRRSRPERVPPAPAGLDDGQCAPRDGTDWRPRRDSAPICVRHALQAARLEGRAIPRRARRTSGYRGRR
jgi:hypothetical protein